MLERFAIVSYLRRHQTGSCALEQCVRADRWLAFARRGRSTRTGGVIETLAVNRKELDRLWAKPNNWSIVYRCVEDPRVIVPRRRRWMGWTINFAYPLAWVVLFFSVAFAVGPVCVLLQLGVMSVPLVIAS